VEALKRPVRGFSPTHPTPALQGGGNTTTYARGAPFGPGRRPREYELTRPYGNRGNLEKSGLRFSRNALRPSLASSVR